MSAYAFPEQTQKWEAGLIIGGIQPSNADGSFAPYWGGNLCYGINEWSAMGLSVGGTDFRLSTETAAGRKISAGKAQTFPIFVDIIFRANSLHESIAPYGVLGLGGMVTRKLTNDDLSDGYHAKVSSGFAGKIGLGVDWLYSPDLIFNLEFNYVLSGAKLEIIRNGDSLASINKDLDYWFIGLGVKHLFE